MIRKTVIKWLIKDVFPSEIWREKICLRYFWRYLDEAYPAGNYISKINNRNTRINCEIYSGVFVVNFKQISRFFQVFLLTLNM